MNSVSGQTEFSIILVDAVVLWLVLWTSGSSGPGSNPDHCSWSRHLTLVPSTALKPHPAPSSVRKPRLDPAYGPINQSRKQASNQAVGPTISNYVGKVKLLYPVRVSARIVSQ